MEDQHGECRSGFAFFLKYFARNRFARDLLSDRTNHEELNCNLPY